MPTHAPLPASAPPAGVPPVLGRLVRAVLVMLPLAHLVVLQVGGTVATAADVAVGLLVLAWLALLVVHPALGAYLGAEWRNGRARGFLVGIGVLCLFGGWVALSGWWGFHDQYALAKGTAMTAFALAALAIATSGLAWREAIDAWLLGAGVALLVTAVGLAAPGTLPVRFTYPAGGVMGLPFGRLSGPFVHPNMFGDWLLVTAVLLGFRLPALTGRRRVGALVLGVGLAVSLALSVSTAWVGAGVVAVALGRSMGRSPGGPHRGTGRLLRVGGAVLAGVTLVALLVPVDLRPWGVDVVTSGLRPSIWRAALYPVLEAPLVGVGASPYVAEAVDPFQGGAVALWDAHNVVLSVLAQFGVVGLALFAWGWHLCLRGVPGAWAGRQGVALRLAWIGVAVGAVFMASEDLRHVWMLLGLTGLAGWEGTPRRESIP